jgi:hypothetical protein
LDAKQATASAAIRKSLLRDTLLLLRVCFGEPLNQHLKSGGTAAPGFSPKAGHNKMLQSKK